MTDEPSQSPEQETTDIDQNPLSYLPLGASTARLFGFEAVKWGRQRQREQEQDVLEIYRIGIALVSARVARAESADNQYRYHGKRRGACAKRRELVTRELVTCFYVENSSSWYVALTRAPTAPHHSTSHSSPHPLLRALDLYRGMRCFYLLPTVLTSIGWAVISL